MIRSAIALLALTAVALPAQTNPRIIRGHPIKREREKPTPPVQPPLIAHPVVVLPGYVRYAEPASSQSVSVNVTNIVNVSSSAAAVAAPRAQVLVSGGAWTPPNLWRPEMALAASRAPVAVAPAPAGGTLVDAVTGVAADSADVVSIDAIIAALYDVISGPAGQKRNWDRFRSLFMPGARLIPTGGQPGQPAIARVQTPDEYAASSGAMLEQRGFFEREIGRTTEQFGRIAHAFSAYDSKWKMEDPQPFSRGINSIQLFNDGTRWWITTVFWDSERAGNQIPAKYINR